MPPYTVNIPPHVARQLRALPPAAYPAVRAAIRQLEHDPRPPGCRRMSGQPGWRVRAGNYRVVYDSDDTTQTVTILEVGHRRDVYR